MGQRLLIHGQPPLLNRQALLLDHPVCVIVIVISLLGLLSLPCLLITGGGRPLGFLPDPPPSLAALWAQLVTKGGRVWPLIMVPPKASAPFLSHISVQCTSFEVLWCRDVIEQKNGHDVSCCCCIWKRA